MFLQRTIILATIFLFFPIFSYAQHSGVIKYQDDFNTLNENFWKKHRGTFKTNLAYFHPNNVYVEDGKLVMKLENDKRRRNRFVGAQLISREKLSYGYYEIRVKPVKCDGVMNAFFLMGTTGEMGHEIDIEFMGRHSNELLTNYWDKDGKEFPKMVKLKFDASKDWHTYAFLWTPENIIWYVDGKEIRKVRRRIPDEPMHLYINLWVSVHKHWAGEVDKSLLPLEAYFDDFKIYKVD
jgi:beta-glucanase (GH16 family)